MKPYLLKSLYWQLYILVIIFVVRSNSGSVRNSSITIGWRRRSNSINSSSDSSRPAVNTVVVMLFSMIRLTLIICSTTNEIIFRVSIQMFLSCQQFLYLHILLLPCGYALWWISRRISSLLFLYRNITQEPVTISS